MQQLEFCSGDINMDFSHYKWGIESGGGGGTTDSVARAAAAQAQTRADEAYNLADSIQQMVVVTATSLDLNTLNTESRTYYVPSGVTITNGPAANSTPFAIEVNVGVDSLDRRYVVQRIVSTSGYNWFRGGEVSSGTTSYTAWRQNQPASSVANYEQQYNYVGTYNNTAVLVNTTIYNTFVLNITTLDNATLNFTTATTQSKRVTGQINNNSAADITLVINPTAAFSNIALVDIPATIPAGQSCYLDIMIANSRLYVKFLGMSS